MGIMPLLILHFCCCFRAKVYQFFKFPMLWSYEEIHCLHADIQIWWTKILKIYDAIWEKNRISIIKTEPRHGRALTVLKNKVGWLELSYMKTYYKATVIKTMLCWQNRSVEQNKDPRNRPTQTYNQPIICNSMEKKYSIQQMLLAQLDTYMQKENESIQRSKNCPLTQKRSQA